MTAPTGGPLMGVASVEAILRLARTVPVFPCRAADEQLIIDGMPKLYKAKSPRIENGFLKASRDPAQIRSWWKRWPDSLVGVPMGEITGLVVVDYDHGKHTQDTGDWIEAHTDALMAARVHGTRSGGLHYLYRIAQGQRYRSGTNVVLEGKARPGIDVRAEGGYVIWWPLHGGTVTNDQAPFLPAGLIDERAFSYQSAAPLPRKEPSPQEWQQSRARIMDALAYLPPDERDLWVKVGMAIHLATGGNDEGFEVWHAWSSGGITGDVPHNYAGVDDCRYAWSSFRHEGGTLTSLGSIVHEAKVRGFRLPERQSDHAAPIDSITDADAPAAQSAQSETQVPESSPDSSEAVDPIRRPMQWTKLEQEKPPERLWRIAHWLSTGPTLLAGSGGVGKTLIAQTIATALAIGRAYVDGVEEPCRILFWACEDDHDELWRRQIAICEFFGITLPQLEGKLIIEPRLGCDNTVYSLVFGRPAWTPLRDELREQIGDYNADVLFLDNIAQTYGANENDRHHVTSFLNGIIGMVRERPFSPVIMGHPSRGLGSEFSGSSAWENAVRMRWYMGTQLPDQKPEDEQESDPNVRYLSKRKTNYSVKDYRKLYWKDGVFVPEKAPSGQSFSDRYNYPVRKEGAIAAVLSSVRKFNDSGVRVTDAKNSPDYLITKMRDAKLSQDYTPKELAEAMVGLRLQGRVIVTRIGNYGNRSPMNGLATADFQPR